MAGRAPRADAVCALLGVTAHGVWLARSHDTFKLADQLRRVSQVADFINDNVPPAAVIVAGEQSGSMRYYTDRPIVRWEAANHESLSAAIATLEASAASRLSRPRRLGERAVPREVRRVPAAALDWPPMLEAGTSHRTRIWKAQRPRSIREGRAPEHDPVAVGRSATFTSCPP